MRKDVNTEFIKKLGKNLRKVRKEKGLSMEQLANKSDVEYSQISRIELGQINTSVSTIKDIADGLEVPVSYIFDFK